MKTSNFEGMNDLKLKTMAWELDGEIEQALDNGASCAEYNAISKRLVAVEKELKTREWKRTVFK